GSRVALAVPAVAEYMPGTRRHASLDIAPTLRRESSEKTDAMLERIGRGRHSRGGETRRLDAALRGTPGVERLGHGAEIRPDAARHGSGDRQRVCSFLNVQTPKT